ncbi:MAG TPA: hypothetical protein VNN13_08430, partial [Methylomirabilota bacterium]|nr:hypothetical protein [Methylomirabilota bacterium]
HRMAPSRTGCMSGFGKLLDSGLLGLTVEGLPPFVDGRFDIVTSLLLGAFDNGVFSRCFCRRR